MADEEKTYLINIESNLQKYIDELKEAKKRLEDAKLAVDELKSGQFKTTDEIEKTNAALRNAQKEYTNSKKLVDLATQANKAQSGSYEQLYRQWQLAQTQLKLMGGAYETNAQGVRVLSERYIEQSKVVADAKKSLDQFGKGINDNRLNVGSYSEALEGAIGAFERMPGPIGEAVTSGKTFITTLASIGPVGAIIAGGLLAISAPLISFFTKSQNGIDLLAQKVSNFKAQLSVLTGELIKIGEISVESVGKTTTVSTGLKKIWSDVSNAFIFYAKGFLNFIPSANKYIDDLGRKMTEAGTTAEELTKREQELEKAENALIVPRAEANMKLKEARLLYSDIDKSMQERMAALKDSIALENKTTDEEIANQHKRVLAITGINELKKQSNQLTREDEKKLQEAMAQEINLRTESVGREVRDSLRIRTLNAEILADRYKLLEADEKLDELTIKMGIDSLKSQKTDLKFAYDAQTAQIGLSYEQRESLRIKYESDDAAIDKQMIERQKEILKEKEDIQLKQVDSIIQPEATANAQRLMIKKQYEEAYALLDIQGKTDQQKRDETERIRKKKVSDDDIKAGFEAQKLEIDNRKIGNIEDIDALERLLKAEHDNMEHTVEYESMSANKRKLIEQQYVNAKYQLSLQRITQLNEERQVVADAFGAMSNIVGKDTLIGKELGVAQATINTWIAASQALKTYPPPFSYIAMATAIATGLTTVKNILAVKIPGQNSGVSIQNPTVLTSSPAAQHAYAPAVGSSILNNTQLNQSQLNALPNQNFLTAQEITEAIKNIPPPIVTVEDINAKTKSYNKVTVRGRI
jgi:hypothetical protein